jgi:Cu(I)/Ag(I) efflux system membrane protein CusA/SilA
MLLYLDHAWERHHAAGRMNSMADLYAAVKEGAVQRIRPKIMTVCAILLACSQSCGADDPGGRRCDETHRRPMIGGVLTSAILELLIYPVIFVIWKKRALAQPMPSAPPTSVLA